MNFQLHQRFNKDKISKYSKSQAIYVDLLETIVN